jgi:phosphinothricin acetyltransferase
MQQPTAPDVLVRPAQPADAGPMAAIYNHYVEHSIVTFEETSVAPPEMASRISDIQSIPLPWLAAQRGSAIVGYAYAGRWRQRSAYRFATEATVYVTSGLDNTGVGSALYGALLGCLRSHGVHVVIGGIALPNAASVRLHEKFGFRKVAHFNEVGFKFDRWVDVGYWQLVLR